MPKPVQSHTNIARSPTAISRAGRERVLGRARLSLTTGMLALVGAYLRLQGQLALVGDTRAYGGDEGDEGGLG